MGVGIEAMTWDYSTYDLSPVLYSRFSTEHLEQINGHNHRPAGFNFLKNNVRHERFQRFKRWNSWPILSAKLSYLYISMLFTSKNLVSFWNIPSIRLNHYGPWKISASSVVLHLQCNMDTLSASMAFVSGIQRWHNSPLWWKSNGDRWIPLT